MHVFSGHKVSENTSTWMQVYMRKRERTAQYNMSVSSLDVCPAGFMAIRRIACGKERVRYDRERENQI